jgi:probable HAF family extracellular repeat protein
MKNPLTLCLAVLALAVVAATSLALSVSAQSSEGPPVTIDPPGSVDTRPFGINASGEIVGLYTTDDGKTHGFLLSDDVYTTIDVPGAARTNALAINDSGQIVGRYDIGAVAHGYLLSDGIFTTIDFPGADGFTVVTDIDPAGRMVGRYRSPDKTFHGFTLSDGIFTTIDHLDEDGNPDMGPQGIQGMAINPSGTIAGYYQDLSGKFHAFLLDDGVYTTIDPPNAKATGGMGGVLKISPNRTVVGSYTRLDDVPLPCGCAGHGFVYRKGAFTPFDMPGAQATSNTGVNARGDIVGVYTDQSNRRHGFLAPKAAKQSH